MPTANSFTALGGGNGFSRCLGKKDVSFYDHVVPLTLNQATQYYWLFYRLEHSASASQSGSSAFDGSVSSSFVEPVFGTGGKNNEPYKRVCSGFGGFFDLLAKDNFSTIVAQVYVLISRLYNGDTDDENNFIGYGIENSSVEARVSRAARCSASYSIKSYMNGSSSYSANFSRTIGTTSISIGEGAQALAIPCVFKAEAAGTDRSGNFPSLSATSSGASSSLSFGSVSSSASVGGFSISKYTIT